MLSPQGILSRGKTNTQDRLIQDSCDQVLNYMRQIINTVGVQKRKHSCNLC